MMIMRIAAQVADLDQERIDGTRVYIREILARAADVALDVQWNLYHRAQWNPELAPPAARSQYQEHRLYAPFLWTQTAFAAALWWTRPDVLWMPMQALPFVRPRGMRSVVTIHDLAFKIFPETFPLWDRWKLQCFTDYAIRHADHIIAISHATKEDLLHMYPFLRANKITVVYHGVHHEIFAPTNKKRHVDQHVKIRYGIKDPYILIVGGLQPRKNTIRAVHAFTMLAKKNTALHLVIVGAHGWLWEDIMAAIEKSPYRARIILTGSVSFSDLAALYRCACVFLYPSLYEGFGMPILEAYAAGTPVVAANTPAVREIAGDAALLVDPYDVDAIAHAVRRVLAEEGVADTLRKKGYARARDFSWEKCARETVSVLTAVAGDALRTNGDIPSREARKTYQKGK